MVQRSDGATRRRVLLLAAVLAVLVLTGGLLLHVASRAGGAGGFGIGPDSRLDRCDRYAAASAARADVVTGAGRDVLVIGDSYSVGLLLEGPEQSWPTRLPGRVHVAGFSGSGFSRTALGCGDVSFARRAPAAVERVDPDLVVVAGGLNDFDQSPQAVTAGFERLVKALEGRRVLVVGPVAAPARPRGAAAVDRLLTELAARHGVAYLSTAHLELPYLADRLHLTTEGHRRLGDAVAKHGAGLRP